MPFLFDDVFAYYDDERLAAAIDMLKKCGHQGNQILAVIQEKTAY